ncbi:MAG TPA: UvrD-helicase domain-containing protein [Pirellulales bacterium]|jgi:ATP-dependent exoDNAse (exonuclease V) beta subunit|nr:UvrD-helicase domain-containing protein [Pirellulales bacterium]
MTAAKNAFPHIVIRASAGTGKTFQLSNRYLGLTAAGHSPDQILAATFARKAAGEILERVLTRLAEAFDDAARLAELAPQLGRSNMNPAECTRMLRGLVEQLHRLQIGTLDSFFVQMAGSFNLELGLPLGWRIVETLEDRRLREEAIQELLEKTDSNDCVRLVHLLSKGEATRSVTRQIMDAVDAMHDVFLDAPPEAWATLGRPPRLDATALADALTQLATLPAFADKNFEKARISDLANADRQDWDVLLSKGLACAISAGAETYSRKIIEPHVAEAYRPLIEHARGVLVARLADQTEGTWRMLSHFHAAYERLKTARRVLRFDDVTRILADAFTERHLDGLAYRLDGPVSHLLLDEFQDTSLAQWKVLLPFARRVTAPGGGQSFFCVGDVKQAIYGWRGGVAEIFDSAVTQLSGVAQGSLVESYRSAQVVIDTVNRVFSDLAANPAVDGFPEVTKAWANRFAHHTTARTELAGRCRLLVAPAAREGEKQGIVTLEFAARHVAEIARQNPERTMGVLVRRNEVVAKMIFELRSKHKVFASEEGGNPLTDSVAVQLVLSLLKLTDHPGDTAARFHVAASPLGPAVGFERFDDEALAGKLALEMRERLASDGYGRTIYDWVKSLAPFCGPRDLSRLLQLVELAYALDDGRIRRTDEFIAEVNSRRIEDPTAAKVRVMTVHQAKGLQFDFVVLPELDVNLKGRQTPRVVVDRPTALEPIRRVCRYTGETVQRLLPAEFRRMFAEWPNQIVNESLCVLYVAMTRAVHALDMIIAPSRQNEKTWPKTYAGLLRGALAGGKAAEPETTLYRHGDARWAADSENLPLPPGEGQPAVSLSNRGEGESRSIATSPHPNPLPKGKEMDQRTAAPLVENLHLELRPGSRRRRGLDYRTPSAMEGAGKVDLRRHLRLESVAGMTRGSIVHAWFERIGWLEDGVPGDADLLRLAARLATPEIDLAAEIKRFRAMLERPVVAAALSEKGFDPATLGFAADVCAELTGDSVTKKLYREWSFVVRQENSLVFGMVDRVTRFYRGDRLVAVDILDFKTDAVSDEAAIIERVGFYRPQIQAYRGAMSALTALSLERISARLLFVEPGAIEIIA